MKIRMFAAAIGLGLVVAISSAVAGEKEVDVSEVNAGIGNDLYYPAHPIVLKNDPNKRPFNGIVKKWHSNKVGGRLAFEVVVEDGLAIEMTTYYDQPTLTKETEQTLEDGVRELKTYHRNGALKSEERYLVPQDRSNTKKDGVFKSYHDNGNPDQVETFVDGAREGPFKRYDKKGNIAEEYMMKAGKKHGLLTEYYANGQIKKTEEYVEGYQDGVRTDYSDKGVLRSTQEFKKGRPDGAKVTYENDGKTVKATQMFEEGRPVN